MLAAIYTTPDLPEWFGCNMIHGYTNNGNDYRTLRELCRKGFLERRSNGSNNHHSEFRVTAQGHRAIARLEAPL